jgi:[methyl-Co(III) methanol-specific corrinoid protein]:coenzyme M methyltransferase
VFAALDAGIDIIAPECAVPVTAPLANVVAIPEAVIDYHANR